MSARIPTASTTSSTFHRSPYGLPNAIEIYATRSSPAASAFNLICSSSSIAASSVWLWLRSRNVGETEYGNPSVCTASVAIARSAPFWFTTIPMISTSSGGSSCFNTSSESAICGTALGETNETASICLNPAPISARRYCTFAVAGIWPLSPCQASRGHSMIFTSLLAILITNPSRKTLFTAEARRHGVKYFPYNSSTFEDRHIEIYDEPNWLIEQFQVRQQLRFMNRNNAIRAFQLQYH